MDPPNQEIIQIGGQNIIGDRYKNSFREHQRTKMNEALNIDHRQKMNDAEIANDDYDLFTELDRRQSKSYPNKESFKTTRDYVQAKLMNNGQQSIDERLNGSRFNFQYANGNLKEDFMKKQHHDQVEFMNQMTMDITSQDV